MCPWIEIGSYELTLFVGLYDGADVGSLLGLDVVGLTDGCDKQEKLVNHALIHASLT
jgi:hypothetical protein